MSVARFPLALALALALVLALPPEARPDFLPLRRVPENATCTFELRVGDIAEALDKAGKVQEPVTRAELYDALRDGCGACLKAGTKAVEDAFNGGNTLVRSECSLVGCTAGQGDMAIPVGAARLAFALSLSEDRVFRTGCRTREGEKR